MKLSIKRDTLLKPLLATSGLVERKQTMPILSNVYLKKQGNCITITASDSEIQASISTVEPIEGEDFITTLPAKKLQDILKVLPENDLISFTQNDTKVIIKSGKTEFSLQLLPAEKYPLLKLTEEAINTFTLSQSTFKKLLGNVYYCMADKEARIFLNATFLEVKDSELFLVATDAHRLGYVNHKLDNIQTNSSCIIPRKSILELYKLMENGSEPITISIYPSQVHFEIGQHKSLITKVIDGKYPDYGKVIPLNNDKLVLINRLNFLASLDRVCQIGTDKLKTLHLHLKPDLLIISCGNEEGETAHDEISVENSYQGEIEMNFNSSYIRDLLVHSNSEVLQWAFFTDIAAHHSVLITTIPNECNFKSVIMPLRS